MTWARLVKVDPAQQPQVMRDKKDEVQGGKGKRHKAEEGSIDDLLAGSSTVVKKPSVAD